MAGFFRLQQFPTMANQPYEKIVTRAQALTYLNESSTDTAFLDFVADVMYAVQDSIIATLNYDYTPGDLLATPRSETFEIYGSGTNIIKLRYPFKAIDALSATDLATGLATAYTGTSIDTSHLHTIDTGQRLLFFANWFAHGFLWQVKHSVPDAATTIIQWPDAVKQVAREMITVRMLESGQYELRIGLKGQLNDLFENNSVSFSDVQSRWSKMLAPYKKYSI